MHKTASQGFALCCHCQTQQLVAFPQKVMHRGDILMARLQMLNLSEPTSFSEKRAVAKPPSLDVGSNFVWQGRIVLHFAVGLCTPDPFAESHRCDENKYRLWTRLLFSSIPPSLSGVASACRPPFQFCIHKRFGIRRSAACCISYLSLCSRHHHAAKYANTHSNALTNPMVRPGDF